MAQLKRLENEMFWGVLLFLFVFLFVYLFILVSWCRQNKNYQMGKAMGPIEMHLLQRMPTGKGVRI